MINEFNSYFNELIHMMTTKLNHFFIQSDQFINKIIITKKDNQTKNIVKIEIQLLNSKQ